MLTLIAAVDDKMGIGKDGDIPWLSAPVNDLLFFQKETIGGAVIMGSKTWFSLGCKPLNNRVNIIVGKTYYKKSFDGASICCLDLDSAVSAAKDLRSRIYGIGGTGVYEALLPVADRIILTKIPGDFNCDRFFPTFDESQWNRTTLNLHSLKIHEYLKKH